MADFTYYPTIYMVDTDRKDEEAKSAERHATDTLRKADDAREAAAKAHEEKAKELRA